MRKVIVLLAVLAAALCAGFAAGPAAAKSYAVTDVAVDAQVLPTGNLRVRETRTFAFTGSFSYVYWDYATAGSGGIRVHGVSGPEGAYRLLGDAGTAPHTYTVGDEPGNVRVRLDIAQADTSATFTVVYTALGAATRWADTGELYWQFVGSGWEVPAERVRITVRPPEGVGAAQVRAWAHGPLWGNVTIRPDAGVALEVAPLPAGTFVEARLLFPAAALAKPPALGAASNREPREQAVLAEEQRLADEANRERLTSRIRLGGGLALGILGPLLGALLVIRMFVRHGREPRPSFKAQYLREIPQPALPPALAGYIWRMGSVANDDAVATLLDLVNRGALAIERVTVKERRLFGKDEATSYRLTVQEERLAGLLPYESRLLAFLFDGIAGGPSLVLSELKSLAAAHRTEFAKGFAAWKQLAQAEGVSRGFLDPTADRMARWAYTAATLAIAASVGGALLSGIPWLFAGAAVGAVLVVLARAVKRRSREAAELHAQYGALKRYMKDFGRLQEKPPDAVALWEQFLVYAVVFGIADEVVKAMRVRIPEVVDDPGFHTMGYMMFAASGGPSPFSALQQGFTQAVSVATSSSSSGSGGGGGFSGGGGGGGGGAG